MAYTRKDLDKSQVELTITVTPAEYITHLQSAAERLSARVAIKGFRKGKAPYDIVKRGVGDMAILQEALEKIVHESYYKAVMEEKLDVVGMPQIDVKKVAPDNDVEFVATVALLPQVTLADTAKIKVKREVKPVTDEQITETIDALRGMHAKEVAKTDAAGGTDKVVLDMNMKQDGVPVDGGQAKDHQVYLSEKHYIPGFNEQITGLKTGDQKTFTLTFPESHFQKQLAGKSVEFDVTVTGVFERQLPELDESFVKSLGQKSVDELKKLIRRNMEQEAQKKADQSAEIEMLDKMIEKSTFAAIPEILIDSERQKMFYELTRDLEKNGISVEQYLKDIKKDEKQLFEDFRAQAEKRAKAALISRQIAADHNISVPDEDVEKEMDMMRDVYKDNPEYIENLKKPEVRESIALQMQNQRVITWLKAKVLGEDLANDKDLSKMGCQDCTEDGDHEHKHDA